MYVAAQVAGGIVAFPFVQALSTPYGVTIGGPGIAPGTTFEDAVWSEGAATFVLVRGLECRVLWWVCRGWDGLRWDELDKTLTSTLTLTLTPR